VLANEIHSAGEFAPQHRFGTTIVRVTVSVPARKIVGGVIGAGIAQGVMTDLAMHN
jgi:phosphate/sulfate permease